MMVFSGYNADKGRIQEGDEANAKNKIAGACFKWASMNGFLKLRRDPGTPAIFYAVTLPHTALPYITTLEAISPILEAQPFINKLIYDMSLDQEFIESVIGR